MPVDAKAESVQKLITKLCCPQMLAVAAQAGADEREGGLWRREVSGPGWGALDVPSLLVKFIQSAGLKKWILPFVNMRLDSIAFSESNEEIIRHKPGDKNDAETALTS